MQKLAESCRILSKILWNLAKSCLETGCLLKSGIMVGLGESENQLVLLFDDLAAAGLDILTIGQYLCPSTANFPVQRYYRPEEYVRLRELAENAGIRTVNSGAYVRSSYLAEDVFFSSAKKNV